MPTTRNGGYQVRPATTAADMRAAQRLRWLCFVGHRADVPALPDALDEDAHDALCRNLLIERADTGELVACLRIMTLGRGAEIDRSYSARYYNLSALRGFPDPMIEIGRFCVHPAHSHPNVLRAAWSAIARHVDDTGAQLLFGCSSFLGTDTSGYEDAFAMLRDRHLAPKRWLPRVKAPEVVRFARLLGLRGAQADPRRAWNAMPPLLRTYLAMGGWVSDHAVMDRQLDTMHVFTGVEIKAIPPARARALRQITG